MRKMRNYTARNENVDNRGYRGFGKCNASWSIALSWDLNVF